MLEKGITRVEEKLRKAAEDDEMEEEAAQKFINYCKVSYYINFYNASASLHEEGASDMMCNRNKDFLTK